MIYAPIPVQALLSTLQEAAKMIAVGLSPDEYAMLVKGLQEWERVARLNPELQADIGFSFVIMLSAAVRSVRRE
jgi:hypothetical protein